MLDVNKLVEGETKVRILSLPKGVEQSIGDIGTFEYSDADTYLDLKVTFESDYWYFSAEHLEIVEDGFNMNTFNISDLKKGDKFKIINNIDNNVGNTKQVKIGDVGVLEGILNDKLCLSEINDKWSYIYFLPHQIEKLSDEEYKEGEKTSPQFTITKSRWDEIVNESLEDADLTKEEFNLIKNVLKNSIPFEVVDDPVDEVLNKEQQTHLDATHVGISGNAAFYYKSEVLKKWFHWSDTLDEWDFCCFKWEDDSDLIPITFGDKK